MRLACRRVALTSVLLAALMTPVSSAAQAQARWYDAYQEGVAAVQKRNWAPAEKLLLQAQSSGPRPGRRVFTFGDTYIPFIPDYYLGVVYLNTNRSQQAEAAFARVNSQKLIGAKDPEYVAFERQGREATFNRAFGEAQQLIAKGDFVQANSRLEQARTTRVDDAKVTALSQEIVQQMAKATPPPAAIPDPVQTQQAPPPQAQAQPPAQTPPANTTAGGIPPADIPPGTSVAKPPVVRPQPNNATLPKQEAIVTPGGGLQDGLLAFFSGDYRRAIPLLETAAQRPGLFPQARVFLACAKVGLVLTGGADAALLREARADFQSADLRQNLTAEQRRFISPKVLEQLERP